VLKARSVELVSLIIYAGCRPRAAASLALGWAMQLASYALLPCALAGGRAAIPETEEDGGQREERETGGRSTRQQRDVGIGE
jgi:hypothetical protein